MFFLALVAATFISVRSQGANVDSIRELQNKLYNDLIPQTEYIVRYGLDAFCRNECIPKSRSLSRCAECPEDLIRQFQ
ncbi:unnamed protein product [Gordionus sp. m RMFG-2023]